VGVNSIGANASILIQSLVKMRAELTDLQRQLGTGKKSDTYAGIGPERGMTVALRARLSALASYQDAAAQIGVRLDLAQTALTRLADIGDTLRSTVRTDAFELDSDGRTAGQRTALAELGEILGLLNTRAGDRSLFSGRAVDRPAVETMEHILDGDGVRAGLRQVMAERNLADLGADGLGRLVVAPAAGTTVTVSEDVAGSPFGFKLAGVTSTLTGASVTGPSGSPASIAIDFAGGNPSPGETLRIGLDLPDGTSVALMLKATASASPGAGEFAIGVTPADTAINLEAALSAELGRLARTTLSAASAMAAANDFFAVDAANPPRRVNGPPFDSATALVSGATDTVLWYTGEAGSDPARTTAVARIDENISVAYGVRANEPALRSLVASVAVYAAMSFSTSDPDAAARHLALTERLGGALASTGGSQTIEEIAADLAGAQRSLAAADDRHRQAAATLTGLLDEIEGVPAEEIAARILALQTRLEASLQVTAMLHQVSLVNYL
jgi:flagellar hook-associated protein 3 FlgL